MSKQKKGMLLAIIGSLFWGIQGPISQFLFQNIQLPTEWLMGVKMSLAGLLIFLFTWKTEGLATLLQPWKNKRDAIELIAYGILGLALVQYMYFLTIKASNAGTATILQSLGTIMIIIFTIFIYKKWPSRNEWFAVILALIGTYFLVTVDGHLAVSAKALIFGLTLALGGALQTMLPVRLLKKYSSFNLLAWGMLMGGVLFTLIHPFWIDAPAFTWTMVSALLFIVLFGTVLSYICFTTSLKYISATSAGLLASFEPASATLGAVLFLGTSFTASQVVGGLLVLSTAFVLSLPEKSRKKW